MGKRWTDEDVQNLKRLARRVSIPQIAEKLDRTVGGVVFKAHALKLSLRPEKRVGSLDAGPAGFAWEEPDSLSG